MNDRHHFRSSPRPQATCKLTLHRDEWSAGPIVSYTRDIGNGGLFAVTDHEQFALGERVQVVLSTPTTWEPLVLDSEVCRLERPTEALEGGIGLRFLEVSDEQLFALVELTESLDYDG